MNTSNYQEDDYDPTRVSEIAKATVGPALKQSAEVYLRFHNKKKNSNKIGELRSSVLSFTISTVHSSSPQEKRSNRRNTNKTLNR